MENKLNIIISIVYKAISVSTERNKNIYDLNHKICFTKYKCRILTLYSNDQLLNCTRNLPKLLNFYLLFPLSASLSITHRFIA